MGLPRSRPSSELSLKARAVGYLSRREYARAELARKLAAWCEDESEIVAVLDALQREGWLSNERYAQSLVHRRSQRQGTARIVNELRQNGVDAAHIEPLRASLRASEYERARAVWQKRFGTPPADRAEYARQARFLSSRGFAHDVIHRILGAAE
jgi:regulatory protein